MREPRSYLACLHLFWSAYLMGCLEKSLKCCVVGRPKGRSSMGWVNEDHYVQEQTRNLVDVILVGHALGTDLKNALEAAKR